MAQWISIFKTSDFAKSRSVIFLDILMELAGIASNPRVLPKQCILQKIQKQFEKHWFEIFAAIWAIGSQPLKRTPSSNRKFWTEQPRKPCITERMWISWASPTRLRSSSSRRRRWRSGPRSALSRDATRRLPQPTRSTCRFSCYASPGIYGYGVYA